MKRRPYPSDLSDAQWAILEPLIPTSEQSGRPRPCASTRNHQCRLLYPLWRLRLVDDAPRVSSKRKWSTIISGCGALLGCGSS